MIPLFQEIVIRQYLNVSISIKYRFLRQLLKKSIAKLLKLLNICGSQFFCFPNFTLQLRKYDLSFLFLEKDKNVLRCIIYSFHLNNVSFQNSFKIFQIKDTEIHSFKNKYEYA